ncbi:SusC/RagA family TonB-linked outer membrane protein [Dyadobacter diqingensis]|uniref:SusC/RagA family TonB-linked outer membrane protein n=1 Tax=Dyadobacter diqingensis TaxID=2938121 RepID=UPI0020C316E1|nr:SusC/RagA family TonB-linked outer membrane protein [Dyadobacter diqingensis]
MRKKVYLSIHFLRPVAALLVVMLLTVEAMAQSYSIKGKVSDGSGQGVPGVSVLVKGTMVGTVTDMEGSYSLNSELKPGNYTLDFSSIGYASASQDITLGNQTAIVVNISIKESIAQLDEVVVTGSTIKTTRRQLGNAINSISSKELANSGSANLFSALQGKVPGAQITQNSGDPSGGMTIRLRGIKSLQGNSDPLYVIDGVILSNASINVSQYALSDQVGSAVVGSNRMSDINPADIESMNIINGAAAAAQYGSRASNGVVLITTKRGKSGAPQINFTTSVNVNELRKKLKISTYGKQFGFASLRLGTITGLTTAQIAANPNVTTTPVTRDGATANLATNLVDVNRYDYQDEIFRTGYGTDNALSISGGNEKTQYYASLSYMKNQGIVEGTDFQRYGLRVRLEQRLASWAKLSAGITYINSFSNEKPNGNVFYSPINSINITNNIYDITKRDPAGNLLGVEPTRINPLTVIEKIKFSQAVNRTVNDVQLNLTPLKGLNIDWIFGIDAFSQFGKNLIPPYPYATSSGLPAERYPKGFAANVSSSTFQYNSDINISYERDLTPDFKLNVIAGTSYQNSKTETTVVNGQNLAPFIETVSGAASTTITGRFSPDQFNLFGVFGQATFGYKNLAFITAAVRSDHSSKFSATQSYQTYPKFSASFIPSDLNFWGKGQLGKIVNTAKLRYSWGKSGNMTGIGSYDRFWQFNSVPYLGQNTIVPNSQLANQRVKPEFMTENEGGIDLTFLNNKLTLGITAYKQEITDLVVNRVVAVTEGGTTKVDNVGEMQNKGYEVSLGFVPIQTKDFSWDVNFIYSHNRNKITKLGSPLIQQTTVSGAPSYLIEGQPASVFYGTFLARNEDGSLFETTQKLPQSQKGIQSTTNPLEYTEAPKGTDGQFAPTATTVRKIIGNPNPKWTGSFVSNLTYKRFGFHFLLDAVQGMDVFNADRRTRQGVGIGDYSERELKGELQRGYVYSIYNTEEWRIDDASFVKLREISLSYQLPNVIKNVRNINIALSGRNLFSWDNYDGFDPETNAGGNSDLLRGVDFGNVPIPRTYQVKISASF